MQFQFIVAYHRARAMESQCAVLFFDEIDALGHARGGGGGGESQTSAETNSCSRQVLAEILIQLTRVSNETIDEAEHNKSTDSTRNVEGIPEIVESHSNSGTTREWDGDATISSIQDERQRSRVRLIVVAATNRPEDCDPALLRRFAIRVFVGLPSKRDRKKIVGRLIGDIEHTITAPQLDQIAAETENWSGSDLESLTREAASMYKWLFL